MSLLMPRVTADRSHRAVCRQFKPITPSDGQAEFRAPYIFQSKARIKQSDHGPKRGGGVIILRTPQQQRAAPFHIPQIDIIAECRTLMRPLPFTTITAFGSRLDQAETGCTPIWLPGSDGRHGGAFGENLRIRTDAHFPILAPPTLLQQRGLQAHRFRAAGHDRCQIIANDGAEFRAYGFRLAGIAAAAAFTVCRI
jgi:hypothetical protein